ncbi:MAG: patatin-like phospholipase family protein [Elusimicrobia bacterium]|nr:patatin-like phospholipase family protein [Elusimicrobiota bacterium]
MSALRQLGIFLGCVWLIGTTSWSASPFTEDLLLDQLWSEFQAKSVKERPKIGLVLGGGGARGLAHIGVLKVFQEEGIPVDLVVGTSVGALIGALYSAGVPLWKIEALAQDIGWQHLTDYSRTSLVRLLVAQRLLSSERMEQYIARTIGEKRFDELMIPFACVAADLKTGEKIIFREGPVAPAVRASATIPGVFEPVEYRHRFLVDGGIVDNLPTDVAALLGADIIVVAAVQGDFTQNQPATVLEVIHQAISIQGEQIVRQKLQQADLVIRPQVGSINVTELWRGRECITAGILATRSMLPEIRRLLVLKSLGPMLLSVHSTVASR